MPRELSEAHKAMANLFNTTDARSFAVYKFIEEVYPAFAEKLFKNGDFMTRLVMSNYNPMDIMDYPICGQCESLAAWDGIGYKDKRRYRACSCMNCGQRTINPVTLRVWMKYELKHKAPKDFQEIADEIVDATALGMLRVAQKQVDDALYERFKHLNPKMGTETPDEPVHRESSVKPKVQVKEGKLSETDAELIAKEDRDHDIIDAGDVYMEDDDNV